MEYFNRKMQLLKMMPTQGVDLAIRYFNSSSLRKKVEWRRAIRTAARVRQGMMDNPNTPPAIKKMITEAEKELSTHRGRMMEKALHASAIRKSKQIRQFMNTKVKVAHV